MYPIDHFLACVTTSTLTADLRLRREQHDILVVHAALARRLIPFLPTFFSGGATYTLNSA